jgi:hypothetical protein
LAEGVAFCLTPEKRFQAIGRLRKEARDEIDRLIGFLDKTDDYVSRELEHDDADSGIADQDGLDEQVPFRDWQGVGMV